MPGCECEKCKQSEYSPCLVAGDEDIVYCLFDPDHIDATTGKLANAAFGKTKLSKTDLSVVRKQYSNEDEIEEKVINPLLARKPSRNFVGFYVCRADVIRSLSTKTEQDICIADDGKEDFPSHGCLGFCEEISNQSKSVKEAVRANLVKIFSSKGIVDDINLLFRE